VACIGMHKHVSSHTQGAFLKWRKDPGNEVDFLSPFHSCSFNIIFAFILTIYFSGMCKELGSHAYSFDQQIMRANDSLFKSNSSPDCDPFIQLLNEIRAGLQKHHEVPPKPKNLL